jgi:DNA-binding HxlR family transcriptional regulator
MAGMRSYADRCGIARGLDVVGERWALLIVRDLVLGPKRFTDLRSGLPGVSPDVLTQRLRELEAAGVVRRSKLPPPAASRVYELTEWGQGLEPVVLALGRWGSQAPFPPGDAQFGVDSVVLALLTMFDPSSAAGLDATYELVFGEERFLAEVRGSRLTAKRRSGPANAAVVVETDPATLAAVLWQGCAPADVVRAGTLAVTGDPALFTRFLTLFATVDVRQG